MFKQTWWVSVAAVLAGLQAFITIGLGVDPESGVGVTARVVMVTVMAAFSALIIIGIRQRSSQPRRSDVLIAVGVVPSALAGIAMFWFPPMWLVTVAGLTVIGSALRDALAPVPTPTHH